MVQGSIINTQSYICTPIIAPPIPIKHKTKPSQTSKENRTTTPKKANAKQPQIAIILINIFIVFYIPPSPYKTYDNVHHLPFDPLDQIPIFLMDKNNHNESHHPLYNHHHTYKT